MHALMRQSNGKYFKTLSVYLLLYFFIINGFLPVTFALDAGNMTSSTGIIGDPTWGDHTIISTQNGAVINWNNFDTNMNQSIQFRQYNGTSLSSYSAVLNRINSGSVPTQFNGALNANGRVFIVNPAGIIFGAESTVNVSQLVASGLSMSNDVFNAVIDDESNNMLLKGGGGDVINNGTINAEKSVFLTGGNVINNGAIYCPDGLVVMAAGDKLRLGQRTSNVIVSVSTDVIAGKNNTVVNNGTVGGNSSPAAKLVLAAGDVFSQTVANATKVATFETYDVKSYSVKAASIEKEYSKQKKYESSSPPVKGDSKNQPITYKKEKPSSVKPEPEPVCDPDGGSDHPPDITEPVDDIPDPSDVEPEPDPPLPGVKPKDPPDTGDNTGTKDDPKGIFVINAAMFTAPVPDDPEVEVSGCPALTKWAANELGIGGGTPVISFAYSSASASGLPACDACASLRQSAVVLRDYSGVHIAALTGLVNNFASNDAPLSEEQDAAITAAIAGGDEGNAEYVLAKDYIDALANYVAILNDEMNMPEADSMEFVLNKYIEPLLEDENVGLATFLAAKLTSSSRS